MAEAHGAACGLTDNISLIYCLLPFLHLHHFCLTRKIKKKIASFKNMG